MERVPSVARPDEPVRTGDGGRGRHLQPRNTLTCLTASRFPEGRTSTHLTLLFNSGVWYSAPVSPSATEGAVLTSYKKPPIIPSSKPRWQNPAQGIAQYPGACIQYALHYSLCGPRPARFGNARLHSPASRHCCGRQYSGGNRRCCLNRSTPPQKPGQLHQPFYRIGCKI